MAGLWEQDLDGNVIGAVGAHDGGGGGGVCVDKTLGDHLNFSDPDVSGSGPLHSSRCAWSWGVNVVDLDAWRRTNVTETYQFWLQKASAPCTDSWKLQHAWPMASLLPELTFSVASPCAEPGVGLQAVADGLAAAGPARVRRARPGDRPAVEPAGPGLARAAPRPRAALRRTALQRATEAVAGGRVPGAAAAVARPLERVGQFLTGMRCGRMAVDGVRTGTAEHQSWEETYSDLVQVQVQVFRITDFNWGRREREVGVACSLSWPSGSTRSPHIHINLYNCSWFFLSQYNITTSNVHKRMGIEHFQYLCK